MEPDKQVANQPQAGPGVAMPKPPAASTEPLGSSQPSVSTPAVGQPDAISPLAEPSSAPSLPPTSPEPATTMESQSSVMPEEQPATVTAPVATAIGEIAAQPEVDNTALQSGQPTTPVDGPSRDITAMSPEATAEAPQPVPATPADTPATPSAPSDLPHDDSKTIKLPVQTSMLPAIAIGVLVILLLLAVAAYAFL